MAPRAGRTNKTSRHKGVSWSSRDGKWRAEIRINTTTKYLGLFDDKQAAADVYDAEARKLGLAVNTKLHDTDVTVEEQQAARGHDFTGVYFDKRTGKYQARMSTNGKLPSLGYYDAPEDAARAWDAKAKELGRTDLNFPDDDEDEEELDEEELDDDGVVNIDHDDDHEPQTQLLAPLPVTAYTQAEAEAALAALPAWRRAALEGRAKRVRAETQALAAEVGAIVEELKAGGGAHE